LLESRICPPTKHFSITESLRLRVCSRSVFRFFAAMSDHKHKHKTSWKDFCFWWMMLFACILNLACCAPPLPWRYALHATAFGNDFISDRSVSPLTVTDQFGQNIVWFKMKNLVCTAAMENSRTGVGSMLKGLASSIVSTATDGDVSSGGAVLGCDAWKECKDAGMHRCTTYGMIAGLGAGCIFFMAMSSVSGGVSLLLLSKEKGLGGHSKKKKKKLQSAEFNTACASAAAFMCSFFGGVLWCLVSGSMFDGLRMNAYYPYPGATAGYFLVIFALVMNFIGMIFGISRQYKKEESDGDDSDKEDYASDVGHAPGAPLVSGPPPATQGFDQGGAPPPPAVAPPPPAGDDHEHHKHHKHHHKH